MTVTFYKTDFNTYSYFLNVKRVYLSYRNLVTMEVTKRGNIGGVIAPNRESEALFKGYQLVWVIEFEPTEHSEDRILPYNDFEFVSVED